MPDSSSEFDYEAAVKACAAGRRDALHQLYEQEGARLLGVAQRIVRDISLAEDIVHDAYLNIWSRAAGFDASRGSARGWIYSITRHLALNAVRDGARDIDVSEDNAVAIDAQLSVAAWREDTETFAWQTSTGRMNICLEQLEPERRHCILHAYVDGLSHSEIAQKLGAPLGTVKAWIKRSLRALRECLA